MRQLPEFITFTGVDDKTDIAGMFELAMLYPIEWGVLLSPKRQGVEPRYPTWPTIGRLIGRNNPLRVAQPLALSAHLCGDYARDILAFGAVEGVDAVLGRYFRRAQVNIRTTAWSDPEAAAHVETVTRWSERVGLKAVMQCADFPRRDPYPLNGVDWLHDASGGRGVYPNQWPCGGDDSTLYGYAGGLNPDNARETVDLIGQTVSRYWLDMESGVRDENNRFSLERCRAVCEAVYGKSLFAGA